MEILKFMIKQKGYDCETFALERCARLFEKACLKKDFGNGRYVRNVLEHAIMKQSKRLMKEYEGMEVGERELNFLMEEDFEMPETIKESEKSSIGFRCS